MKKRLLLTGSFFTVLGLVFLAVRLFPGLLPPPAATAHGKAVAASTNDFGFRLLAQLSSGKPRNVFFSPVSLSMALSMAYHGAAGTTQTGMAKTLGIGGMDADALHDGQRNLLELAARADPQVQTSIANAMWAQQGYQFRADYLNRNRRYYRAQVTALDLQHPRSADRINDWISRATRKKITKLVQPGDLDETTKLVLTNAVYFNGTWSEKFKQYNTLDDVFTLLDGTTKQLPMMNQTLTVSYHETADFQLARLPYGSGRIALYLLLPKETAGLSALLPQFTAANWEQWLQSAKDTLCAVTLPRFTADYEQALNAPLAELGMTDAFTAGVADFSGMDGTKDLFISLIRHKAVLDINEERTEAAAVTDVGVPTTSAKVAHPQPVVFRVDRPFLCAIRDDATGALLFLGTIVNPE